MRRQIVAVLLAVTVLGCAGPVTTGLLSTSLRPETCIGELPQGTCDQAAQVALTAVAPSGWTPTNVWIDSGQFCPTQDCLFDPSQNFPYPDPPAGGQWVANAEIAFAGTDQHAGLNIAEVNGTLVPVLIGYRVPLLTWCTGGCPSSVVTDGNYKLELVLPRLTWTVGDPISGTAILSLTDSQPTKVAGASELIAFAFDEVGGIRHVAPTWALSCVQYPLDPATPQSVALYKSGAFQGNEPNADFLRSFFADPAIHLPGGTWDITAIASFSEGGCAAPNRTMRSTVRIHVTG